MYDVEWSGKVCKVVSALTSENPTHGWIWLILQTKPSSADNLNELLPEVSNTFDRLTKRKAWPAIGWVKFIDGNPLLPGCKCDRCRGAIALLGRELWIKEKR